MGEVISFSAPASQKHAASDEINLEEKALELLGVSLGHAVDCLKVLRHIGVGKAAPAKPKLPDPPAQEDEPPMPACAPPPGAFVSHDCRRSLRQQWHDQWRRMQAAKARLRVAELSSGWRANGEPDFEQRQAEWRTARQAYKKACLALMLLPAVERPALFWKRGRVDMLEAHKAQWWPVLAADEARYLTRMRGKGGRGQALHTVDPPAVP